MTTSPQSIGLVFCSSFIGSFGGVFLKSAASKLELTIPGLLRNWQLAAGIFAFVLSSVFYVMAVKGGELSVLYPMVAIGNLWTLLWARMFFHEAITRTKVLAMGLILFGIALLGMGNR